jgi:hypothetical protein
MSNRPYVPESTTEVYYPKSKRKIILNNKGEVISDTNRREKSS